MDIAQIRKDTRGVQHVLHLNNAGAALMPTAVSDTLRTYLAYEEEHGGYEAAAHYAEALNGFYNSVAQLINAQPEEIAYAESATVAWGKAFFAIPFKAGDVIITGPSEYASNYIGFMQARQRYGIEIRIAPAAPDGSLDVAALANMITPAVKLIAITHMPTNGGLVNDAEAVGAIARQHKVLYLLDACQTAGQYPLDVEAIGCDFLSATGRKFLRGPRGTGFLYVRKQHIAQLEPEQLDLHSAEWQADDTYTTLTDARKFEVWECSVGSKLALKAAVDYLNSIGIHEVWARIQQLASHLRQQLAAIPHTTVHDLGTVQGGIVTFSVAGVPSAQLKQALHAAGINVSVVLQRGTLLDSQQRRLPQMVRSSVHYYNTEAELNRFVATLQSIIANSQS